MSSIPSLTADTSGSSYGKNNCCQGVLCCVKNSTINQNFDNHRVIIKKGNMIPTDSTPTVHISLFKQVLCCFSTSNKLRDDKSYSKQNLEARNRLYQDLKDRYGEKAAKVAEYYLNPSWKEGQESDGPLLLSEVKEAFSIAAESKNKMAQDDIKEMLRDIKLYMEGLKKEHATILSTVHKDLTSSSSQEEKKKSPIKVRKQNGVEETFSRRIIKKDLKKSRLFLLNKKEIQEIANEVKEKLEEENVDKVGSPKLRSIVSHVMKEKKCKIKPSFHELSNRRQSLMENLEKIEGTEQLDPKDLASLLKLRKNKA